MNILDFGKFNLDNTLTQNKSLLDNHSGTNNGYTDSNKSDFNNMLDKINSKAKSLEPENKINVSDNKTVSRTSLKTTNNSKNSVSSDKNTTVTNNTNVTNPTNSNKTENNTNNFNNNDFTKTSGNDLTKSSNNDLTVTTTAATDCSDVKTASIQYDTSVSDDNTSLVNEDLVSELENLLIDYSDVVEDTTADLTEMLSTEVDTDLLAEEIVSADEILISDLITTEDVLPADTEETSDEVSADIDVNVFETVAADVQDTLVKENLDMYLTVVSDDETIDVTAVTKDTTAVSDTDLSKNAKTDDIQKTDKNNFAFAKDDKTVSVKDNSKLLQNDDNNEVSYDNQEVINLEETVEVSDAVKDMNVKTNTNKTSKDSVFDNTKITKKDLEELKVKIEDASYSENSGNSGFQSNQQTAQENLIKLSIDGMDNLTKMHKTETPNLNFTKVLNQTNTEELTQKNIVSQIYSKIQDMRQGSKMVMTLNPESLGKVQIEIVNSKTGLMAQMSVTNNAVKDILSKDLDGLRSALTAQGINVDSINVKIDETLNNSGKDDYLKQEKDQNGNEQDTSKNKKDEEEKKEKQKVFETLMDNIVKDSIKE